MVEGSDSLRPVLVVAEGNTVKESQDLATELCSGLHQANLATTPCPVLEPTQRTKKLFVGVKDFDTLMDNASCVVLYEHCLDMDSLETGAIGAVATRARQHGVPCHAVVDENRLDPFCQRMLDLQHILINEDNLEATGHRLGLLLAKDFNPIQA